MMNSDYAKVFQRMADNRRRCERMAEEIAKLDDRSDLSQQERARELQRLTVQISAYLAENEQLRVNIPLLPVLDEVQDEDLVSRCTERAKVVLRTAFSRGTQPEHRILMARYVLDALTNDNGFVSSVLGELEIHRRPATIQFTLVAESELKQSEVFKTLLREAFRQVLVLNHRYIGTEHILLALTYLNPELFHDADGIRKKVVAILG